MSEIIVDMVRVQEKYQVTIPMEIREILNIEPGNFVQFEWDGKNHTVMIHKVIPQKVKNQAYIKEKGEAGGTHCDEGGET